MAERIKKLIGEKGLLLLIGGAALLFLLLPSGGKKEEQQAAPETEEMREEEDYQELLERRLSELLSRTEGVGKAEVMITVSSSGEKLVEREGSVSEDSLQEEDGSGGSRFQTGYEEDRTVVFTEDQAGNRVPYVVKELVPEIRGVVVLCEGGRSSSVQAEVCEAVEALLGVPAHKIKVLKKVSETK